MGADSDKLFNLVFDKKHPANGIDLVKDKSTLMYKLKDKVVAICDRVYLGEYKLQARIDRDGKKINTIPAFVVRTIKDGGIIKINNNKKYVYDNVVQLNEDNVLIMIKMFSELYRYRKGKGKDISHWDTILNSVGIDWLDYSNKKIKKRIDKAVELINLITIDILGEGRILQTYTEKESGRLFAEGWLNIQTLPKEMRYIAMAGKGYYEYDIENAHYNFLYQLNRMYKGHPIDYLANYINHTKSIRESIAQETQLPISIVKVCLLTIIYGATIERNWKYDDKLKKKVNTDLYNKLVDYTDGIEEEAERMWDKLTSNKTIQGIYYDVKRAKNDLKRKFKYVTKARKKYLLNPLGKLMLLEDDKGKKRDSQMWSHILQGIEASVILFVLEEEMKKFIMPHHDGWVSSIDWNTDTLENIILAKSKNMMMQYDNITEGFSLKITKKRLNDIEKGDWAERILKVKRIGDLVR